MLDCGSTANLIRRDVVERLNATREIRKTTKPTSVIGFNDVKTTITEDIVLNIAIGPLKYSQIFLIVPKSVMSTQELIHGKPSLLKMGLWQHVERFMRERLEK